VNNRPLIANFHAEPMPVGKMRRKEREKEKKEGRKEGRYR
jgi:hypothetical protein